MRSGLARGTEPKKRGQPPQQRRDLVLLRLLPEQFLQLVELLGMLGGDVVRSEKSSSML